MAFHRIGAAFNSLLGAVDLRLVRDSSFRSDRQARNAVRRLLERLQLSEDILLGAAADAPQLPPDAADYLTSSNPRLVELRRRYRGLASPLTAHSYWTENFVEREVGLASFRGDCAYVWQYRDMNTELHFLVTAYHLQQVDRLGLFDRLEEDSWFGAKTVCFDQRRLVSRDLLDSIVEIGFLDRTVGLAGWQDVRVLDIGAGYGRLAHRLARGLPGLGKVVCTDAVAESTFLAEYYLRLRGVEDKTSVVPLDELESTLAHERIDIATNVCSFSECSLQTVEAWLDLLVRHGVRYLMIVPDRLQDQESSLSTREADGSRRDYHAALSARGYQLKVREPKYLDPAVQLHGVSPTDHYLFELRS